jgi:HNH endonuclease
MSLSRLIRQQVRQRANSICEYCHSAEDLSASLFEIDHIHPVSLGGLDDLANLALACQRCNAHHYNFVVGQDPLSGKDVALFHPRRQVWREHFMWDNQGTRIVGITEVGRATLVRLDLNDEVKGDGKIICTRTLWVSVGWHPPIIDRQLDF